MPAANTGGLKFRRSETFKSAEEVATRFMELNGWALKSSRRDKNFLGAVSGKLQKWAGFQRYDVPFSSAIGCVHIHREAI